MFVINRESKTWFDFIRSLCSCKSPLRPGFWSTACTHTGWLKMAIEPPYPQENKSWSDTSLCLIKLKLKYWQLKLDNSIAVVKYGSGFSCYHAGCSKRKIKNNPLNMFKQVWWRFRFYAVAQQSLVLYKTLTSTLFLTFWKSSLNGKRNILTLWNHVQLIVLIFFGNDSWSWTG